MKEFGSLPAEVVPRVIDALRQFITDPSYPSLQFTKLHERYVKITKATHTIRATHRRRILLTKEPFGWVVRGFIDRSDSTVYKSE